VEVSPPVIPNCAKDVAHIRIETAEANILFIGVKD